MMVEMKNLFRIAVMLLVVGFYSLSLFSQQKISDKMFNDFKMLDAVTYLSFSKGMIDFVDFDIDSNDDDIDDHKVSGDLNEVKLVIFKPDFDPKQNFRDQVLQYLKKGNYTLIEDDDVDDKDDTEVWIYRKGRKIYECHVIFQGDVNGVLLSFFGDFNIKDIDTLKGKIEEYKD